MKTFSEFSKQISETVSPSLSEEELISLGKEVYQNLVDEGYIEDENLNENVSDKIFAALGNEQAQFRNKLESLKKDLYSDNEGKSKAALSTLSKNADRLRVEIDRLKRKRDKNELTEMEERKLVQLRVNLSALVLLHDKFTGKTVKHRRVTKSGEIGGHLDASKNQADYNEKESLRKRHKQNSYKGNVGAGSFA